MKSHKAELLTEHLTHPRNVGSIEWGARGLGKVNHQATGDEFALSVQIEHGQIVAACFEASGNPMLTGCGSYVTERVNGKDIDTAAALRVEDVIAVLGLAHKDAYCAQIAIAQPAWRLLAPPDQPPLIVEPSTVSLLEQLAARARLLLRMDPGPCAMSEHLDLGTFDPLVQDHARSPRHTRTLAAVSGRGMVQERDATVRIALHIVDDRVMDATFRVYGNLIVNACASFLIQSTIGQTLPVVRGMRSKRLAHYLKLSDEFEWCAAVALKCLLAALKDYMHRQRELAPLPEWHGSRHRHRGYTENKRSDDFLAKERSYIVGALRNLLLFLGIGANARHIRLNECNSIKEDLICDFASMVPILATLPEDIRRVIDLIGLQGMTDREAGKTLGISHMTVNKRLWRAAAIIQSTWRKRPSTNGARRT